MNPPNLQKYVGFNAGDFIKAQSAFQPHFVNDTDAAILAEYQYLNSDVEDVIYLTISTGIGMAYIRNGQLVTGIDGNFGEIGHTIIKIIAIINVRCVTNLDVLKMNCQV